MIKITPKLRAAILALPIAPFDGAVAVRDAFKATTKLTVSQWSPGAIRLSAVSDAEPGRYDPYRTPYVIEPLDAFGDDFVQEITLMWSTQTAKTTTEMIMVCYAVDQKPGPALFVGAIEALTGETSEERVKPMLRDSPVLRRHIPKSPNLFSKYRYRLARMDVHFAWAGSAAKLASKPKKYLFFDESAKFPPASGKEADPIALGKERQRTFWNSKTVNVSTPVESGDNIDAAYNASDMRRFKVPCPHCGEYQHFRFEMIKWPDDRSSSQIRDRRLAWYECEACTGKIYDAQKQSMMMQGVWCPEGCTVDKYGLLVGEYTPTRHRGYHIWAAYSPWLSFSDVAYEFMKSKNDRKKLQNFVNSWLGEPWTDRAREMAEHRFHECCGTYTRGTVHTEAQVVLAGADVQKNGIYYYVAGWSNERDEYGVDWDFIPRDMDMAPLPNGLDNDMDMLRQIVLDGVFAREDGGINMICRLLAIDSRYRTHAVERLARMYPQQVRMIKGATRPQINLIKLHAAETDRKGKPKPNGLRYAMLDTNTLKDMVADLYEADPPKWHFPEDIDKKFMKQFLSEAKVVIGHDASGNERTTWQVKPGHSENHYWDCSVYCTAAAEMVGVGRAQFNAAAEIRVKAQKQQQRRPAVTMPDGRPFFVGER